jgi:hypothetical protein
MAELDAIEILGVSIPDNCSPRMAGASSADTQIAHESMTFIEPEIRMRL